MEAIHKKLQNKTLLIAEDDPSTLKWLIRVLSLYFKEVIGASDALQALELFKKNPTDVILTDIQMPQVDGLNLAQKIASISPQTLRVIMTAFNDQIYMNRAIESEVNFYFKKPIDIDSLLVTISTNLPQQKKPIINLGKNYFYKQNEKNIHFNNKIIKLTKKEVLLLELFLENKNSIITLDQIEDSVWNEPTSNDAIRMVLVGLRKKLYPNFIENIKGLGYKLNIS